MVPVMQQRVYPRWVQPINGGLGGPLFSFYSPLVYFLADGLHAAGLPHPLSAQTAVLSTNKVRQRERLAAAGVPQPRWWVVGGGDAPQADRGPVVVKAPDRQGQKGLTLVKDPAVLPAAIATARSAARNGLALIEELVDGPEVTVIGFSAAGEFVPLLVTDRIVAEPPAFGVALVHVWPVSDTSRVSDIEELVRAALTALGITDGPSYTQVCVGPEGPRERHQWHCCRRQFGDQASRRGAAGSRVDG